MKCSNCGFETLEKINFCPVCATEINQSTPEVNQTNEMNQTPNGFPTDSQIQTDNYIFSIKDWFVANVVLIVISSLLFVSFCCMNIFAIASVVLSIIGVVYSNKVKKNIFVKKYDQAIRDSKTAKLLFFISLGILIFSILVTIAMIVFVVAIRLGNGYYPNSNF